MEGEPWCLEEDLAVGYGGCNVIHGGGECDEEWRVCRGLRE